MVGSKMLTVKKNCHAPEPLLKDFARQKLLLLSSHKGCLKKQHKEDSGGQVEEKMAPDQNKQLENIVDALLKNEDVRCLELFLQQGVHEGTIIKCSQHFLTKLDKLICRGLDQKDPKSASLGFAVLHKCGKNLRLPRHGEGVPGLMAQDLLEKMVQWFEKCRQLWIQCGPQWDETLFNLSEDFFEALMVVHDSCKEGKCKVTESFLYPVGQLTVDPRIYILIQKEAIRKFNLILDKIPLELKKEKKILASQEASDIMTKMAGQILDSGDYDLQIALMEALCRMASPGQRRDLADQWFSMEHVASAFVKIRDSEFETDCRKFFNLVNGMQGDRRRVYSYPCLEVYLDKYELLMPSDEKLDEFWIDFNLGSSSISFYFTLAGEQTQEGQWETICINENEVDSYTVKEQGKRSILYVKLTEVVIVGPAEGSSLTIHFSSSLDILQAARSVFGSSKNKGFVGKTGTSEVETMVKIIMEENSSQPLYLTQVVPESQLSLESDKNTAPYLQPASSAPVQTVTPARMKMSEATSFINSSAGGGLHGASFVLAVPPSAEVKRKQPLEMVRSCGRVEEVCKGTNKPLLNTVDVNLAGQAEELENGFVPDTQPRNERNISNLSKLSVSEMIMMPTQKMSVLPRPELCSSRSGKQQHLPSSQRVSVVGPTSPKQLHAEVTKRLQQVLKERKQETTDDSKSRGSADRYASALSAAKGQQARQKGLTKPKGKGQVPDSALIMPPAKASTTKAVEKNKEPSISADAQKTLSDKEKSDAELAGSMVKQISSRYDFTAKATVEKVCGEWNPTATRPIFNKSWFSTVKREASGGLSLIKSYSKTATRVAKKSQDVFDYHTDAPLTIGGKDKTFSSTSALSSSSLHDSSVPLSTTKKGQPVAKEQRHVKKHLFSDTDYAPTDVSWLRESSRKPKPKVTKYPRQAPTKPTSVSPYTSYESPNSPLSSQKPAKNNTKPSKKKPDVKEKVEQPKKTAAGTTRPHAGGRRPLRAAATLAKSYKEPDTDDSLSESEKPLISKHTSSDLPDHAERTHSTAKVMKKQVPSNQQTKSYKELDNKHHGGQSESVPEQPRATKKSFIGQQREIEKICSVAPQVKKTKSSSEHSADSYRRLNSNNQSDLKKSSSVKQQRLVNAGPETSKLKKRSVSPAQEQMNTLKGSWATRQTSFCQSPPFIERMRSAERSDPTLGLACSPLFPLRGSPLPASPDPSCQDTPSPILLLPKACSTVSSKGSFKPSSLYSAEKQRRSSKAHSIQSDTRQPSLAPIGHSRARLSAEMSPVQQRPTASPPSPLCTLPLLSSTVVEQDKLSMPSPPQLQFVEDQYSLSKVSVASLNSQHSSSAESSGLNNRVKDMQTAVLVVSTEKSPPSNRKPKSSPLLISGPSRKRYFSSSSLEEEEEMEEKKASKIRGRPSPRLKPRKLFKSFVEVSAVSDRCLEMSSSHTVSSSHWEDEAGDMDVDDELELSINAANASSLCQQLSSELKNKFQNRCKMMEVYNKQSLTAVQQHVSSLNMQVSKQRTQKLEQLQEVLLEEIHKLEQNHTALKSMEKDMMMFWKKQSVAFQSYHEQETRRNETLGKVLQNNVYHSVEYEEKLFTSQMCLIRKDMKSVQDGLLSQMQEVEVQSVKKGLHALFFP